MADIRVLVVEDEPVVAWCVGEVLRPLGYRVTIAASVRAGLDEVRKHRPDVVFLDLGLPDGTGFGLLEQIKREVSEPTAVVVMTALTETCPRGEALRRGALEYLAKPFDFDRIPEVTARALAAVHGSESARSR